VKYLTTIWTTLFLLVILVGVRFQDPFIVEQIRLNTFDQYIKSLPEKPSNDVVLINIGEEALEKYGQFPWPRQEYAQMINM